MGAFLGEELRRRLNRGHDFSLAPFGIFRAGSGSPSARFVPMQEWMHAECLSDALGADLEWVDAVSRRGCSRRMAAQIMRGWCQVVIHELMSTQQANLLGQGWLRCDSGKQVTFVAAPDREVLSAEPGFEDFIRMVRRASHTQSALLFTDV